MYTLINKLQAVNTSFLTYEFGSLFYERNMGKKCVIEGEGGGFLRKLRSILTNLLVSYDGWDFLVVNERFVGKKVRVYTVRPRVKFI